MHDPYHPDMYSYSGIDDPISQFLGANNRNNLEAKVTLSPRDLFNVGIIYEAGQRLAQIQAMGRTIRELTDTLKTRTEERDNARYDARQRQEWRTRALTAEDKLDKLKAAKRKQQKRKVKK